MLDGDFEEMFNDRLLDNHAISDENSNQLADIIDDAANDSDKDTAETESGSFGADYITIGDETMGGVFGKNKDDFNADVDKLKDELLAIKPIVPKRISGIEGKLNMNNNILYERYEHSIKLIMPIQTTAY